MTQLAQLVDLWLKQIKAADATKSQDFSGKADECWKYYLKDYKDIYVRADEPGGFPVSQYKLRLAKARQFVSLMMPFCHQRVPVRTCSPASDRLPLTLLSMIPGAVQQQMQVRQNDQLASGIMQWVANYLPLEYGLSRESEIALPEAFVKGRALVWCDAVQSPAGIIPAHVSESVDNLLCDPDAVQFRDCGYIVRIRHRSAYRVAEDFAEFGVTVEKLRSQQSSQWLQALKNRTDIRDRNDETDAEQARGDVVTYFEIYSRVGIGSIFRDSPKELQPLADAVESLGGNVWLAICPGVDRPLNVSEEMLAGAAIDNSMLDALKAALAWPIPFHEDFAYPWPCQVVDFLPNHDNPWATPPMWARSRCSASWTVPSTSSLSDCIALARTST